ncbi:DUF4357 domain-containing protein [Halomonas sp. ATBC28]|nr:DUF4357 domain-containing protein [Halomonas sp. ATBC28]
MARAGEALYTRLHERTVPTAQRVRRARDARWKTGIHSGLSFLSPTTAAGILVVGSANGRLAWKGASGKTLKAIQDERLASI